MPNILT